MQTINTCNFNTVKEAYLHVISCILVTLIMSLQYTAYGSSGQQTSFSLFHSRPAEKTPLFPNGKSPHSNQHPLVFTVRKSQTPCQETQNDSGASSWSTFHGPKPDITAGT